MSVVEFNEMMTEVANSIDGLVVDAKMAEHLNQTYPTDGPAFKRIAELCSEGEEQGWLMSREHGGIKYDRAIKPDTTAGHFSVDVVRMKDVKGPHHIHTNGEIGAIIPISGAPKFDDFDPGWYVYPPGSEHHPTVSGGDAYILYLLPNGAIEFTGK